VEKIRKPSFILVYEGVDISQNINDLVISITYTDNLTGTADEVSIELDNRDFRFWKDWQPRKKDSDSASPSSFWKDGGINSTSNSKCSSPKNSRSRKVFSQIINSQETKPKSSNK